MVSPRWVVVYRRVSWAGQRDDLVSQIAVMERFYAGRVLGVSGWVSEVGGGMNFRWRSFVPLLGQAIAGEVSTVVVAHRDLLARFGFELIDRLAGKHGCEIVVANQDSLSPQRALVEDLLATVHVFCCRLDGLRRYEKQLKAEGAGLSVASDTVPA